MDGIKLSILLCSVPSRLGKYPIINELCRQANKRPVEVIYLGDNYNWTIGEKRNKLIQLASGKYCTFVDDDDRVTVDYVDTLLNAMEDNPDVITFNAEITIKGLRPRPVYYSYDYTDNKNTAEYFERLPNHLMCFKRDIYNKVPFENRNMMEDSIFAGKVRRYVETELRLDRILYYYDSDPRTSESIKRTKNDRRINSK